MNIELELLLMAFMIGIGSTGHCMMMCGGISSALAANLSQGSQQQRLLRLFLFHAGRLLCYSLLGVLVGAIFTSGIGLPKPVIIGVRTFAGVMLILIGLYVAGFSTILRHLENRLSFVWRRIQPLLQRFIPITHWYQALFVGFLWGFLPCGIVYSTLLWAGSSTMSLSAGVLMLFFGAGTMPGLLAMNIASQQLASRMQRWLPKQTLGVIMILFGVWTLPQVSGLFMQHGAHQHDHGDHMHHSMPAGQSMDMGTDANMDTEMEHHHH